MSQSKKPLDGRGRSGRRPVCYPDRKSSDSRRTYRTQVEQYWKQVEEYREIARRLHRKVMKEESGGKPPV